VRDDPRAQPIEWLATINREAKMPTAGGETVYGVAGFYPYIAAGAVNIVMRDVKYCGGVLQLKKIALLAEGAGLLVALHGVSTGGILRELDIQLRQGGKAMHLSPLESVEARLPIGNPRIWVQPHTPPRRNTIWILV
jgi:hypothetical protein